MKNTRIVLAVAITGLFSNATFAQSAASEVGRNVNQQQRIEQAIKSGELSNREAGRLEHGQASASADGQQRGAQNQHVGQHGGGHSRR
jgi:hypothetical protein